MGVIREARIRGDFLVSDRAVLERLEQALAGRRLEEAQAVVEAVGLPPDVRETLVRLLAEVGQEETLGSVEASADTGA